MGWGPWLVRPKDGARRRGCKRMAEEPAPKKRVQVAKLCEGRGRGSRVVVCGGQGTTMLDEPTPHNLESIRLLNCTLLPVRYGMRGRDRVLPRSSLTRASFLFAPGRTFYDHLLKYPELTRLAFYNDVFVGCVVVHSCARRWSLSRVQGDLRSLRESGGQGSWPWKAQAVLTPMQGGCARVVVVVVASRCFCMMMMHKMTSPSLRASDCGVPVLGHAAGLWPATMWTSFGTECLLVSSVVLGSS